MNKKHLIWIIPLCVVIGYLTGLYYNIPQNITIDYGDNMVEIVDKLDNLQLNFSHCPDCITDCVYDIEQVICFEKNKYHCIRKIERLE